MSDCSTGVQAARRGSYEPVETDLGRARRLPRLRDAAMTASEPTACAHEGCARRARVCRECVRAVSFKWWDAIARHWAPGDRCAPCETGHPEVCGDHFIDDVAEHRAHMRELGNRIGEPEPPDVIAFYRQGFDAGRAQGLEAGRAEGDRS